MSSYVRPSHTRLLRLPKGKPAPSYKSVKRSSPAKKVKEKPLTKKKMHRGIDVSELYKD